MDGRLNLNAHGTLAQTGTGYLASRDCKATRQSTSTTRGRFRRWGRFRPRDRYSLRGLPAQFAGQVGAPNVVPPIALPRGQATGPAEDDLLPLFRQIAAPTNFNYGAYQSLLTGTTVNGSFVMGRYGPALPGTTSGIPPGARLTWNTAFPYSSVLSNGSATYWSVSGGSLDAYGSPPDPHAMGAVGLDPAGRFMNISMGSQLANGHYDMDLTRNAPHAVDQTTVNNAFGVAEMERICAGPIVTPPCFLRDWQT